MFIVRLLLPIIVLSFAFLFPSVSSQPASYISVLTDSTSCSAVLDVFVDSTGLVAACKNGIVLLNATTLAPTIIANNTICQVPSAVTRNPVTGAIIFACQSQGIYSYDGTTITAVANTTQCMYPIAFANPDPKGRYQIAACTILAIRIDFMTGNVDNIFNFSQCQAMDIAYYTANGTDYVLGACALKGIVRLNMNSGEIDLLADYQRCNTPNGIMWDSVNGDVLCSCRGSGILRIQNNSTYSILATPMQCLFPSGVWYDTRLDITYASCISGDTLAIKNGVVVRIATYDQCSASRGVTGYPGGVVVSCYKTGPTFISGISLTNLASFTDCQYSKGLVVERNGAISGACENGVLEIANNVATLLANDTQCYGSSAIRQNPITDEILVFCPGVGLAAINSSNHIFRVVIQVTDYCREINDYYVDPSTGMYTATCDSYGVVQYQPSSSNNLTLLSNINCRTGRGVFRDPITGDFLIACFNVGLVRASSDGSVVTVIANSTQCGQGVDIISFNGIIVASCGYGSAALGTVIMINGSTITGLVSQSMCAYANWISRNPNTGLILVACVTGAGLIAIDSTTMTATTLLTTAQCTTAIRAYENAVTGTIYASCGSGLLGLSSDFKCYEGTQWQSGVCVPCGKHTYRSTSNLVPMGQCTPCPVGFVAPQVGSTECTPCPSGTYESKRLCLFCAAGTYQPQMNATTCIDCNIGSYAVLPGSSQCSPCEAGSYSATNGSVSCLPCNSGSASNVTGLTHACDGCPAGTYQASIGQTECLSCPNHFYSEQANSTSCTRCANEVNEDRTTCTVIICDANSQFNDATNRCEFCPLSMYSSRGGKCTTCVTNTYTPAVGSGCAPCDDIVGLDCAGGIASVSEGFWAFLSDDSLWTNPATQRTYQRYQTSPCPNGYCPRSQLQLDLNQLNDSVAIQYCASPRLNSVNNTLCAQCEESYLAWGDSCVVCTETNGALMFGYFVLSFALVLFLFYSSTSSSSAGSLSIFLFFIQTAALEMGPIVKYLSWIQLTNLDPKSTATCLGPWSAYNQTLFSLFIPVIMIIELMFVAVIHFALNRLLFQGRSCDQQPSSNSNKLVSFFVVRLQRFSFNDYRVGTIAILLFCYTQVANASLKYLHCTEVDGQDLNFSAPTINCRSSEYQHYLGPVLVSLILYIIGLPVGAFFLLWRHKDSLYLPADADIVKSNAEISSFLYHWSPFYRMYARHAWFWQCWVLLRRAAFVVTAVLLMQQPAQRFMTFAFLHFASLILHQLVKPYAEPTLNHIESASYILLVSISEFLLGYEPPYPEGIQAVLLMLTLPPGAAMISFVVYQQWKKRTDTTINNVDGLEVKSDPVKSDNVREMATISSSSDARTVDDAAQVDIAPSQSQDNERIVSENHVDSDQQEL